MKNFGTQRRGSKEIKRLPSLTAHRRASYSQLSKDGEYNDNSNSRRQRRQSLKNIQLTKLVDKLKYQKNAYAEMDESILRLYGVGECRISVIKQVLRKKCYVASQLLLNIVYVMLVIASFICIDIWYSERCEEYLIKSENPKNSDMAIALKVMSITELALLALFALDILFHMFAFGCLYMHHFVALESFLILANTGLLLALL